MQGLNVEEIKAYNSSLREYKERASQLRAEIEFNSKEVARVCEELTTELGIQVTPENLEEVYLDRVARINNTLATGTEILRNIKAEEEEHNKQLEAQSAPQVLQQSNEQPVQTTNTLFSSGGQSGGVFADIGDSNDSTDSGLSSNPFAGTSIQI